MICLSKTPLPGTYEPRWVWRRIPPSGRGEPMSVRRFWDHLTGSLARTSLRIPADPFEAERQFCRQQVRAEEID